MKHRFLLPAALVVASLSLAACQPDSTVEASDATSAPTATETYTPIDGVEAVSALEEMTWVDNGADAAPGLEFTTPINFTETGGRLIEDGDGAALVEGQVLNLEVVQFSGTDGSVLYSTYDDGAAAPATLDSATFDPVLYDILTTAHVGAKLLYAIPDSGSGAVVVAFIVSSAVDVLASAEGTAVDPVEGLPTVTLDADGKPAVSFDGATMPEGLVAQDLITGTGSAVVEGQTLTVNYTGWVWDGEQFDSSWDAGTTASFTLATGSLIDGWVQGLVGKNVGSRVLLVIPPELGYGDEGSGDTIPGGSTLVFVVDILAAY